MRCAFSLIEELCRTSVRSLFLKERARRHHVGNRFREQDNFQRTNPARAVTIACSSGNAGRIAPGACFGTPLRPSDPRGEYLVVVFEADEQMFGEVCTCRQRKLEGGGFDGIRFACFPDSIVGFRSDEPATVEFVRNWLSFLQKAGLAGRGVGFR